MKNSRDPEFKANIFTNRQGEEVRDLLTYQ